MKKETYITINIEDRKNCKYCEIPLGTIQRDGRVLISRRAIETQTCAHDRVEGKE